MAAHPDVAQKIATDHDGRLGELREAVTAATGTDPGPIGDQAQALAVALTLTAEQANALAFDDHDPAGLPVNPNRPAPLSHAPAGSAGFEPGLRRWA